MDSTKFIPFVLTLSKPDGNAVYTDIRHKAYRSIKGFQIEVALAIEWGDEDGKDAFKGYGCHRWVLLYPKHLYMQQSPGYKANDGRDWDCFHKFLSPLNNSVNSFKRRARHNP